MKHNTGSHIHTAPDNLWMRLSLTSLFVSLTICPAGVWKGTRPATSAEVFFFSLSPSSSLFLPPSLTLFLFYSSPSFHTGRVLTPLAEFTDLSDCGLNAARLVFSTCPSTFATLAAQFPPQF